MSVRADSLRDPAIDATLDMEQQIYNVEQSILPLRKAQKKLRKIEGEISDTNVLIASGIGSRQDKVSLRQTKNELRQRRIELWKQLEALPSLETQLGNLHHDLDVLRRRHGIL